MWDSLSFLLNTHTFLSMCLVSSFLQSVSLNLLLSHFLTLTFTPASLPLSPFLPHTHTQIETLPLLQTMRPSWPVSNSLAAADELGSFASQTSPELICTLTHACALTHSLMHSPALISEFSCCIFYLELKGPCMSGC